MRVRSLDVLRGITILVMVFVNDLAGVKDVPGWMKHAPRTADAMTFVDVVFPAFLLIVGVSIPLALARRRDRHEGVWGHVAVRTLSLLVLGVLEVNAEHAGEDGRLSPALCALLLYASAFLVWNMQADAGRRRA